MEHVELIEAVADLQDQIGAMRLVVKMLLVQHALHFDDPNKSLESMKALIDYAISGGESEGESEEAPNYTEVMQSEIDSLFRETKEIVAAVVSEPEPN